MEQKQENNVLDETKLQSPNARKNGDGNKESSGEIQSKREKIVDGSNVNIETPVEKGNLALDEKISAEFQAGIVAWDQMLQQQHKPETSILESVWNISKTETNFGPKTDPLDSGGCHKAPHFRRLVL